MSHDGIAPDRRLLPSTIAWLSVCLLAAGWGSSLPPESRRLWLLAGAFGLTAAVGLDVARRARAHLHRRGQCRMVEQRIERSLNAVPAAEGVRCTLGDVLLRDPG